jgi:hypothetical protein
VTEADLINLGLTSKQAAEQVALLKEGSTDTVPQGTTVAQGLTVPAPTRMSNPFTGLGIKALGQATGLTSGAPTLGGGISSLSNAADIAAIQSGLSTPLVASSAPGAAGIAGGTGAGFFGGVGGTLAPGGYVGSAAGAGLGGTAAVAAPAMMAAIPAAVAFLVLQAAMAPKITPKQRAEKANWDYQNFLNMRPDVRDLRREGGAGGGGPFVDPKSKFLKQMMKNALFAQNQGAGDLLLPQLQQGIGGIQFNIGGEKGDQREGLFVPRVVRQEGQGRKQFLTGANIRDRLGLPAVQGLPPPRVYRDPQGGRE